MDRNEAQYVLDETNQKLSAARSGWERLSERSKRVDAYLEPTRYEEILSEMLVYNELIRSLEGDIRLAQERLDR